MTVIDWLSLAAIVLIPIFVVFLTQWLQNGAKKREDKMKIFTTLMNTRALAWTVEMVEALNMIDVVFIKDRKVRETWAKLFESYNSSDTSEIMNKKRLTLKYKLLEEMAISLGYKDKITWERIQNPYIPQGMLEEMNNQARFKQGQLGLAEIVQQMKQKQDGKTSSEENKND